MDELLAGLVFLVQPGLLLLAWFFVRGKNHARRTLSIVWLLLILVLVGIAFLDVSKEGEVTHFGVMLILSSSIWLSGPALIWSVAKDTHPFWSVLALVILAPPSMIACLLVVGSAGYISGL